MSNARVHLKLCPFCAEEIKLAAIVCKHCSRDLPNGTGKSAKGNDASARPSEIDADPRYESCWDCGFVQLDSSGPCVNCGVELSSEKYVSDANSISKTPSKAASAFSVIGVVVLVLALVAGAFWFLNGLDPDRKPSSAVENYPVATTVKEAVAFAVAHYCPDAPSDFGSPSNWTSTGVDTRVYASTAGGLVVLNAGKPAADGGPGEVTAFDALSREALEYWNCQSPMLVLAGG